MNTIEFIAVVSVLYVMARAMHLAFMPVRHPAWREIYFMMPPKGSNLNLDNPFSRN